MLFPILESIWNGGTKITFNLFLNLLNPSCSCLDFRLSYVFLY